MRVNAAVDVIMVTAAGRIGVVAGSDKAVARCYPHQVKPFNFARYSETLLTYRRFVGRRAALDWESAGRIWNRLYAAISVAPRDGLPKTSASNAGLVRCLHRTPETISALEVADRGWGEPRDGAAVPGVPRG